MNPEQDKTQRKNRIVVHLVIIVVIAGLIMISILIANNNFDFVNFLIKLHGG